MLIDKFSALPGGAVAPPLGALLLAWRKVFDPNGDGFVSCAAGDGPCRACFRAL